MPTRRQLIAWGALVAGVGLVGYAVFSQESDEERIKKKLDLLEAAVRVDGEENPVFRGARLDDAFEKIFDPGVSIDIPELTTVDHGRQDLVALGVKAGTWFHTLDLDFKDVRVTAGAVIANVETRAVLVATRASNAAEKDERNVTLAFSKANGDWKIHSISVAPKQDDAER